MRRRARGEAIERARLERLFVELRPLRERLMRWAGDHARALRTADAMTPRDLSDRAADNWRPLLAIADLAGGDWPKLARDAATALSAALSNETVGIMLLEDMRMLFADLAADKLASATICERLGKLEERPWPEFGKSRKPITVRQLARLVEPFGIKPKTIRLKDQTTAKGYDLADFTEAFERYLGGADRPFFPVEGGSDPSQRHNPHGSKAEGAFSSVTAEADVQDEKMRKPLQDLACDRVTDREPRSETEWTG
jgi:hypothetical protein